MKHSITPEEHARVQRRRGRQALGLLVAILVVVGFVTVLRAGVGAVANLFDDTAQKQEYEDKLEGLVLFDPMPFDGIANIDDLTLREAAVWGCIYSIQETQGGFDNYNTDPDTEQLLLPSLDVDAYLAKLLGPGFKLTHRSFEMEDMTIEFDDATQCYKIPVTGTVGYYRAVVTKLFKRSGKLHVTVGYIPTIYICSPGKSADFPGRGAAENGFLTVCYFRSNLTTTSRYHRYGTMFQIIHSSIRM